MNIIGVIPARGGSKGLPDKNIRMLLGKPLIAYTIEMALKAKTLQRVIVSTNDERIARISQEYGAEVIKRPNSISSDTAPIELALRHVVDCLEAEEGYHADIVVLMQANIPIRKDGVIDEAVNKLIKSGLDSVITICKVRIYPQAMKKLDGNKVISYMYSEIIRRQDYPKLYFADGAVLAIRKDVLMKTAGEKRAHGYLGRNVGYILQDEIYSIEIDSPFDLILAESLLKTRVGRFS